MIGRMRMLCHNADIKVILVFVLAVTSRVIGEHEALNHHRPLSIGQSLSVFPALQQVQSAREPRNRRFTEFLGLNCASGQRRPRYMDFRLSPQSFGLPLRLERLATIYAVQLQVLPLLLIAFF